jgi:hypothetical protein
LLDRRKFKPKTLGIENPIGERRSKTLMFNELLFHNLSIGFLQDYKLTLCSLKEEKLKI